MLKVNRPAAYFFEFPGQVRACIALAKVPLCLLIGCSTLFGYLLARPVPCTASLLAFLAVFILAAGCASLNSFQEYRLDGQLQRTRKRPLVMGQLPLKLALVQACLLIFLGLTLLLLVSKSILPFAFAVWSLFLYNGIYTPLKQQTALAIIPGAVCGALPPYIGWLAGGGEIFSFTAVLLVAHLLLWQVPHFWLVLLTHKDDYGGSSLPTLLKQFSEKRLKCFFVTWIGALGVIMAMYAILPPASALPFRFAIIANPIFLSAAFVHGLVVRKNCNYRLLFILLNCSLFLHMLFVSVGRLVEIA